jgi:ketosteroid isomerase-like protein
VAAKAPEDLNDLYNEAFRAGDIERLLALYEPDSVLAPTPDARIRGRLAIRERLALLLALKGELRAEKSSCVECDGVALLRAKWQFTGADSAGRNVEMSGASLKVARRQADGSWLYVIDLPTGGIADVAR